MTKKEQIIAILEKMGYSPNIDSDGDVAVRYELKYIYFITDDDDPNDHYASVLFPQFYEIKEGEETLVLTTCNKMAREVRLVKVYLDGSFKNVTASCEFFYTDEEALVPGAPYDEDNGNAVSFHLLNLNNSQNLSERDT